MRWIKTQKQEAVQFLKQHFGADEATAIESYNYVPLIVDGVRVTQSGEDGFGVRRGAEGFLG